jgi:NAD-dependent SIR2 family protein deacetylase
MESLPADGKLSSQTTSATRDEVLSELMEKPYMKHTDKLFMHGRGYHGPAKNPVCTWKSKKPPRDDHDCPSWLTASEFEDVPEVCEAKCKELARYIRISKKTVLYTGAGISASVIGQAARSGENTVGWKKVDRRAAKPTPTHFALAHLVNTGLIHSWIQQNHDGLPQKAGCPQHLINEIHGSWFDPGNPVVKYSGSLHDRTFPWMEHDSKTADLVIVIGSSLGGLTADQVATNCSERSTKGKSIGTVCINLQQTVPDSGMSLRIFGKSDNILQRVVSELGMCSIPTVSPKFMQQQQSRALVPYDKIGNRLAPESDEPRMYLDLSDRAKVKLSPGHNIQGAQQPMYMHIGAKTPKKYNGVLRQPGRGHGFVMRREQYSYLLCIDGVQMRLGLWWLDAAIEGKLEAIPVVNVCPIYEGEERKEHIKATMAKTNKL